MTEQTTSYGGVGAPKQSLRWLRPFLPKRLQPLLRGLRKRWQLRRLDLSGPLRTVYPFTQASRCRQQNLLRLASLVVEQKLDGAVLECGVLDGGTSALMAYGTRDLGLELHLFDAWEGLPETTEEDGQEAKKWVGQVVGSPKRVRQVLQLMEIEPSRVHIHRGWFNDTFPTVDIPKIALLHVDCDFYQPTVLCIRTWYPRLVAGGFIQFDDYSSFSGCRKAVDEFLQEYPEVSLKIEGTVGRGEAYYLQKPAAA